MKILQVVPRRDNRKTLKRLLIDKERALRGSTTTFRRKGAGRWLHKRYTGWITWDESSGGILLAEIHSRQPDTEWRLLQAFVGYLDRHLAQQIDTITVFYR